MAICDFIEGWYNRYRRHSALGNHSPVESERRWSLGIDLKAVTK
jgi:transposase InsO family protein